MPQQHHLPSAFWLTPTYLAEWTGNGGRMMPPAARGAVCAGLEIASLASRRAQAYVELPSTVALCKGPGELMAAQMQFWRKAVEDYTECNRRVIAAWTTTGSGATERGDDRQRDYITFREPDAATRQDGERQTSRRAA